MSQWIESASAAVRMPAGFPVADGLTVANGAPLQTFEPGEYRLDITVTDRNADDATVVEEVEFTVR